MGSNKLQDDFKITLHLINYGIESLEILLCIKGRISHCRSRDNKGSAYNSFLKHMVWSKDDGTGGQRENTVSFLHNRPILLRLIRSKGNRSQALCKSLCIKSINPSYKAM